MPDLRLSTGDLVAERYRVVRHLGSGGMGDVYVVEHHALGRQFALKQLNEQGAANRTVVQRFLREARTAAATGHPGVVEVFDLGFDSAGHPFLVMELLRGLSLRERLRKGGVTIAGVIELARGILQPLAVVHDQGVIHRDIKPDNIFLPDASSAVHVKLLDFGLARSDLEGEMSLTHTGAIMGTPLYMSPEQIKGSDIDRRADLYSVAAVLYECIANRTPFTGGTYGGLLSRVLTELPDPAPLARAPGWLQRAVLTGLAKNRDDRFPDAQSMLEAVSDGGARQTGVYGSPTSSPEIDSGPLGAGVATPKVVITPVSDDASAPTFAPDELHADTMIGMGKGSEPGLDDTIAAGAAINEQVVGHFDVTMAEGAPIAPADDGRLPGFIAGTDELLAAGRVERAADIAKKAALRNKTDLDLAARAAVLVLFDSRKKGYKAARKLVGKALSPFAQTFVGAIAAISEGRSNDLVPAMQAHLAAYPDDLAGHQMLGRMLFRADRWAEAEEVFMAILDRWPAFEPAVNRLLEKLYILGRVDDAEDVIDSYIAHAPDGVLLDMFDIEQWIGERRYRDALDRVLELETEHPGREKEFFQFKGDLYTLLWEFERAMTAYDQLGAGPRRDYYVAGVLLHAGRWDEARALYLAAIEGYPGGAEQRLGRLGTLAVDAANLALSTADGELADRVLTRVVAATSSAPEARWAGDVAFVRGVASSLAGKAPDASDYPLGSGSPHFAITTAAQIRAVWQVDAQTAPASGLDDVLARLQPITENDGLHFGKVNTNVLFPLFEARARAEAAAGNYRDALRFCERVIAPRHFDSSRGLVIRRAMQLRADITRATGQKGQADAMNAEINRRWP